MGVHLEIITPKGTILSCEAEYVSVPGAEGVFGVLPGHIPFLSALAVNALHYETQEQTRYVFISGGIAEVLDNNVAILAESAEEAENIDFARAEAARNRAEARLARKDEVVNETRAQAALCRAVRRLDLRGRL
ncbi:MAG: F0F1 ATP synthase subunit epsilon [Deltaproteobacteria bacterium]|jgi:F-type H+-transporting ATPase subunit epsilon|nr:F0F1 ATP synthase subunit epsilon [Deltaproteobacteria bacterium]